ncbi:hypothetical protein LINPERHAP1_LOCUS15352 [Linum perenne]
MLLGTQAPKVGSHLILTGWSIEIGDKKLQVVYSGIILEDVCWHTL